LESDDRTQWFHFRVDKIWLLRALFVSVAGNININWSNYQNGSIVNIATGTEKIDAFTRFFDDDKSLDVRFLNYVKQCIHITQK
jgi:hypothetical protein